MGMEEDWCIPIHNLVRLAGVDHPVYLNLTAISPAHVHTHAKLEHYDDEETRGWEDGEGTWEWGDGEEEEKGVDLGGGMGVNLTYELRKLGDLDSVVGGLDHAHAGDCSHNGVPILHRLTQR